MLHYTLRADYFNKIETNYIISKSVDVHQILIILNRIVATVGTCCDHSLPGISEQFLSIDLKCLGIKHEYLA